MLALVMSAVAVPASAQSEDLDAWRESMAEWAMQRDAVNATYEQDRARWEAQMEEANRPMSKKKKVLIALGYVGDKALTGYMNYHTSRAAIRTEMKRFDSRFSTLGVRVGQEVNAGLGDEIGQQISQSTATLLAGQDGLSQEHAGLSQEHADVQNEVIGARDTLLAGQDGLSQQIPTLGTQLRPCEIMTPFGIFNSPEPCRSN
jgi:hypothetical protein